MSTLAEIAAARDRLAQWHRSDPRAAMLPLGEVNWTYDGDRRVEAIERLDVIVMGFNAGAGRGATETRMSRSERVWKNRCARLADGLGNGFVLAELILLATLDEKELRSRYGDLGPAFAAGADINREVIAYHRPKVIFQAGLGHLSALSQHYGLAFVAAVERPEHPGRTLLRHYQMPDGVPWLSFLHFATPGFSKADFERVRQYAAGVVGAS